YDKPLELLSYLGFFYINERDKNEARIIFNRVRERKPDLAARGLGILNLTEENYKDALMYFKMAIDANKQDSMAWFGKGLAHEWLGNITPIEKKKPTECPISIIGEAVEDPPLYDPNLFSFKKSQDKELKNALNAYDETIRIDPEHCEAWYRKGLIHCKRKEFEETEKAFAKALSVDRKNAEVWYHKGVVLSQRQNYEEAIEAYDEVIKIVPADFVGYAHPPDSGGYADEGQSSVRMSSDEKESGPDRIRYAYVTKSWLYKGVALSELGKYDDADNAYSKALENLEKYPERFIGWWDPEIDREKAVAWYYKGMNLGKWGSYENAFKAFSKVPDTIYYPSARFVKSVLNAYLCITHAARPEHTLEAVNDALGRLNKYSDLPAIKGYEDVLNSALRAIKGIALAYLGKYEDALECFNEVIERDPTNALIWNRKYLALKALGCEDEAEVAFVKAEELGYVAPHRFIKVHFKKESIHADQGLIVIDSLWQASESDPSQVWKLSGEETINIGVPKKLYEGYELTVVSIDSDSKRVELYLTKDGATVNGTKMGDEVQYTYEYHNMREEDIYYLNSVTGLYFKNLDLDLLVNGSFSKSR
ncbi:MAG TPA: tetratricopeptide repeat protein, partial [Alphaproteobacteria bacterium]|nr:tetratricopeptide repeat protein [Alphaproteobacteria bacterium]